MARAKKTEAPKVDIGGEIFSSLRDLEKLKAEFNYCLSVWNGI